MKKNTMMRLASFLLIAVLITTSTISGTYAKYVTTGSANDSARVAKWGIDILTVGNLFGKDYEANTGESGDTITVATSESVHSSNDQNVVAPGTKNDVGYIIGFSGTPEVSYVVSAKTGTEITGKGENKDIFLDVGVWGVMERVPKGLNAATDITQYYIKEDDGTYTKATGSWQNNTEYYELDSVVTVDQKYYPINWYTSTGPTPGTTATKNLVEIASGAMKNQFTTETLSAGTSTTKSFNLTWEWPFYTSEQNDKMDTILGNLANNTGLVVYTASGDASFTPANNEAVAGKYCLDIVFNFEVAVTQVN